MTSSSFSTAPTPRLGYRPRLADMRALGRDTNALTEALALEAGALERLARPRVSPPERFVGREGFKHDHLEGFLVEMPTPGGVRLRDVLPVGDDRSGRLNYMHFSVVMSGSRKIAMFVAVNIEGKRSVSIARERDKWFFDGRIPLEAQLGEELYRGNRLDRGHLVRREDPNWGDDADVANADTFHFTNCAPQMDAVNQRTWLGLENYILQNSRAWKERCSVFTGPVFSGNDLQYRGTLIPKAFWKVVAFLSDDGKPSATAYLVKQDDELSGLEAAFGAYKTYQRSVRHIQDLTGLSFGDLPNFDGFSNEETASGLSIASEVVSLGDIRL